MLIHLAYLGRGLYTSLHPRKCELITLPIQEHDLESDVEPVILEELTADESSMRETY